MTDPLVDYFRCPERLAVLEATRRLPREAGYFRFGGAICYGRQGVGTASSRPDGDLVDVTWAVSSRDGKVILPFDLSEVLDNLRYERYVRAPKAAERLCASRVVRSAYYFLRPALPVVIRKHLQRASLAGWKRIPFPRWPVDLTVETLMKRALRLVLERGGLDEVPFIWFWPDGAPACAMVTHDVESAAGARFCGQLMDLDDQFGVKSAFQVVPDAPWATNGTTKRLVEQLTSRGFEVNVHDLLHDGHLFRDRTLFLARANAINARGREFGSRGFRSGAMYRRQEWFESFDCAYDMSVPNVAHLEAQRGGCCTVMPHFIGKVIELPLTTVQDYSVFHVLGTYSTALWRQQTARILEENGLVSFIVHPDYLLAPGARDVYTELLRFLVELRDQGKLWLALPSAIAEWWRARSEMRLVRDGASWRIEGPDAGRARVAHARLVSGRLVYDVGVSPVAAA